MILAFNPIALNALGLSVIMRRVSLRDSAGGLIESSEMPLSIILFLQGILKAKTSLPQAMALISIDRHDGHLAGRGIYV